MLVAVNNQAITINEDDELIFADGFESAGP
jgi:hypothetical protein